MITSPMEYLLIHRMMPAPIEVQRKILEVTKKRMEIATGAKEICSYKPIGQSGAICIWEAPSIETLKPLLDQLSSLGVMTEITPLEKSDIAMKNWERHLAQMSQK